MLVLPSYVCTMTPLNKKLTSPTPPAGYHPLTVCGLTVNTSATTSFTSSYTGSKRTRPYRSPL